MNKTKEDLMDRRSRRSPDRRRNRSRSRSPRSRDYCSSRKRSRSRERRRSRSRERRNRSPKVEDIVGGDVNLASFDIDEQQKKLELLMQQRREKVEKWRLEQAKKKSVFDDQPVQEDVKMEDEAKKKWSLEDDSDEENEEEEYQLKDEINDEELDDSKLILPAKKLEEDNELINSKLFKTTNNKSGIFESTTANSSIDVKSSTNGKIKNENKPHHHHQSKQKHSVAIKQKKEIKKEAVVEEEGREDDDGNNVDPLDLYMEGIENEVKKESGNVIKKKETILNDKKISVIIGVAKKKQTYEEPKIKKGELLEQNQDALEFSSEEEASATDDLQAITNNLMSHKSKKLTTISKDDITYSPFEKSFYVEVAELARMTSEQVEELREELEGIKVKGKGCPKPIKSWAHSGVSKKIFDSLKRYGYEKPTPIQAQAIPAIMCGRDIIGIAKTGSGKTLAFLLPMFRHILAQPALEPGDGPISIIMTPTRELATQITSECKKFAKYIGLHVVAVYGGTPISDQISELKPGCEIVVCTPGRMIDMLAVNSGRVTNLKRCTYLVLDEADRMFDMGFEPQVTRIIDGIRPDRQTVVFSATFPRVMETLARRILNRPIEIAVGGRSIVCKDIEQNVIVIEEEDKFRKLLEVLGKHLDAEGQKSAIVFVDKQENADFLLKELMHAMYTCLALHGGIDQMDRDSTISDFKANKVSVLVATSVAARGLDIKHCIVVINYDCPNHYEDYVHRCGRTGRAGNKGYAYTFITPDQGRYAYDINKALESSGNAINEKLVALFNNYKSRQEALGRTVVAGGSGFSGKGFKFNEQEAQLVNEKRKYQKVALGLQDSDDEDPEADLNQEIENMLAPKKLKQQQSIAAAAATSQSAATTTSSSSAPASTTISTTSTVNNTSSSNATNNNQQQTAAATISNIDKVELAKKAASRINLNLASKATSNTEAFLKGETNLIQMSQVDSAKSLAERRAEMINAKFNYRPAEDDRSEEQEEANNGTENTFKRFEIELEINDFPQPARWRVTSKEAIAQIAEYSEAGITVRGTFIPEGNRYNPELGERKLYLAIEGTSELAVNRAKNEVIRLIREELMKLQTSNQPANKGRYKVV